MSTTAALTIFPKDVRNHCQIWTFKKSPSRDWGHAWDSLAGQQHVSFSWASGPFLRQKHLAQYSQQGGWEASWEASCLGEGIQADGPTWHGQCGRVVATALASGREILTSLSGLGAFSITSESQLKSN